MALCVVVDSVTGSLVPVSPQPAEMSGCLGVVLSGSEVMASAQFDASAFSLGFEGGLLLFAVGCGIGLIINAVRKIRI